MKETNEKITAFYCLSKVKSDKLIQKQKDALLEHAKEYKIEKYEFYIDNGYSNKLLARPALKKLIGDSMRGKIATVVVTDLDVLCEYKPVCLELLRTFSESGVIVNGLPYASLDTYDLLRADMALAARAAEKSLNDTSLSDVEAHRQKTLLMTHIPAMPKRKKDQLSNVKL